MVQNSSDLDLPARQIFQNLLEEEYNSQTTISARNAKNKSAPGCQSVQKDIRFALMTGEQQVRTLFASFMCRQLPFASKNSIPGLGP
jgi:hypothetical protein